MKNDSRSWSDGLILSLCAVLVASLLTVGLQRQRSVARTSQCTNNLRQLGLAMHNYHSAFRQFPAGSGGTDRGSEQEPLLGNANRLGPFVGLLPFLEQQKLWEQISNPLQAGGVKFPTMGPVPWFPPDQYPPWSMRSSTLTCPTDPDSETAATASSYVINYGDGVLSVGAPVDSALEPYTLDRTNKRGAFIRQRALRIRDFLDGTSNTVLFAERKLTGDKVAKGVPDLAMDPSRVMAAVSDANQTFWDEGRGGCWADGSLRSLGFQTILPPNSPSATSDVGELEGVMSASSHHSGGVQLLFCDGSVQFATNSIDVGDITKPSVAAASGMTPPGSRSPYGLWGALGTRASREVVNREASGLTETPTELSQAESETFRQGPPQTWKLANGKSIRGHLVAVVDESRAVILPESQEQLQTIELSDFESADAYRAVKTHFERQQKENASLIQHLETLIGLLEKKDMQGFVETALPEEMALRNQAMPDSLKLQRGMFIFRFDQLVHGLREGTAEVKRTDDGTIIELSVPGVRLQVKEVEGRYVHLR